MGCAVYLAHVVMYQDKWRNLSVNTASQGSKDKSRSSKSKVVAAAQRLNIQISAIATPLGHNASYDTVMDDPSNSIQDGKNASRFVYKPLLCLSFLHL